MLGVQVQQSVDILEQAVGSEVVVVGGGPTGVELTSTIADRLGKKSHVHLISSGSNHDFQTSFTA